MKLNILNYILIFLQRFVSLYKKITNNKIQFVSLYKKNNDDFWDY